MIEKAIHYCWFGDKEMPAKTKRYIESWAKFCPDYTITCWNESNYDISKKCEFVQEAYRKQKWAFVSDYARLDIIYEHGGIYLDTDVELINSLDHLLDDGKGFFGFEDEQIINTGIGFACEKGELILREMMEKYEELQFRPEDMGQLKCPIINTEILKNHGAKLNNTYQIIEGRIQLLPTEFLCPLNIYIGKTNYTTRTVSIHHYSASWQEGKERFINKTKINIKRLLPLKIVQFIRKRIRGRQ